MGSWAYGLLGILLWGLPAVMVVVCVVAVVIVAVVIGYDVFLDSAIACVVDRADGAAPLMRRRRWNDRDRRPSRHLRHGRRRNGA